MGDFGVFTKPMAEMSEKISCMVRTTEIILIRKYGLNYDQPFGRITAVYFINTLGMPQII